jgi:hypothetical protein
MRFVIECKMSYASLATIGSFDKVTGPRSETIDSTGFFDLDRVQGRRLRGR